MKLQTQRKLWKELEAKLGRTVISSSNATTPELLDDEKRE